MTQRDVKTYLFDISQACQLLKQFTHDKSFADYDADPMLRSAVERQFEIVGEALNRAIQLDPGIQQKIVDSRLIIDFRNRLIHGYASVSNEVVWDIIESKLDDLMREIDGLLGPNE